MRDDPYIENRTFEELKIGESASLSHTVTQRDIDLFATVTGDVNPAHVDPAYAATDMFHHIIIQGMWGAGLISATLGTRLPGPGTIYLGQDLRFTYPVSIGDTITSTVTVREKKPAKGDVVLDCVCANQTGRVVITGSAFARAPTEKVRVKRVILPSVRVNRHDRTVAMLARASGGVPIPAAVVYPVDTASLLAAMDAAKAGLIIPILIGPASAIQKVAKRDGVDIGALRLIDVPDATKAAAHATALARSGEVGLLMKGDLHTSDLMHAVVADVAADQPRLADGRAGLPAPAADNGCCDQYRAEPGGQGRHHAERDRPGTCSGHRAATRGHPCGNGNDKRPHAVHP
jgi:acyl dehydratase